MAIQNSPMRAQKKLLGKIILGLFALLLTFGTAGQAQPAHAQSNASEPSKQDKLVHYSLYYENFKNEDYKAALNDLRWMLEHAPTFPNNDDRNIRRAIEAYAEIGMAAEDPEIQQAYLDTAFTMLDTAPDRLQEHGLEVDAYEWTMRKGRFVQQYGDAMKGELKDPIQYYEQAFEMAPEKIQPYFIDQILQRYAENNSQTKALEFMDEVEAKRSEEEEVMKILDKYRGDIFDQNPAARIEYMEDQLEANPDNEQLMTELFELYTEQGYRNKAKELSSKILETDPSFEIYRKIARMRLDDGNARQAFNLYQEAMKSTDAKPTAQDYYNMGVAQRELGNFAQARNQFRKALEIKSDFGQAYIAIGDLYAQAVSDCGGSKMARNDKAVYWAAVDMYRRAKQVDSSVASTANSKINTYRQYFPNNEDIFYREDWQKGQSFRIDYGCYSWINESTTVRTAS